MVTNGCVIHIMGSGASAFPRGHCKPRPEDSSLPSGGVRKGSGARRRVQEVKVFLRQEASRASCTREEEIEKN